MTIRIVLADDHPIVLDGLAQLLCVEGEFGVVARARNGEEALHAVHQYLPDILVLDLRMPVKGGLAVIREMKRDAVPTQVVLLTAANDDDVIDAIRLGVRGVILKDMAPKLLLECVRKVHAGGKWLAKEVTLHGMDVLVRRETIARAMTETLTPREMQVARMISDGLPCKTVAHRLSISEGTAKLHLHHVYEKLQLDGRVALVRYMQSQGLV